ncbi:hypothetical protein QMM96_22225 [Citrobacter freundii]|uniref:hypothetical protein n=1 Tax=Citrobacter freundii TaxID=546 RepID=UPI002B2492D3|nr:hypothetical protein [Citrobacter freundii]MEB2478149.1 hypothetical protein [Citrobacter freundii]
MDKYLLKVTMTYKKYSLNGMLANYGGDSSMTEFPTYEAAQAMKTLITTSSGLIPLSAWHMREHFKMRIAMKETGRARLDEGQNFALETLIDCTAEIIKANEESYKDCEQYHVFCCRGFQIDRELFSRQESLRSHTKTFAVAVIALTVMMGALLYLN